MEYEKAQEQFEEYVSHYDFTNEDIKLKYHHSYAVVDLMERLANELHCTGKQIVIAKIIGLLHDIGRFEQIRKFQVISDQKTNTDHAEESISYLFDQGHIRDFIKDRQYDTIIKSAIRYHNKFVLPKMSSEELFFSQMIRDMDKVDIFKQVALLKKEDIIFQQKELTKEVLTAFLKGQLVDRKLASVDSKSDYVVGQLSFLFDMNFPVSYQILEKTGNLALYLQAVQVDKSSVGLFHKLEKICHQTIMNSKNRKGKELC